MTELETFYESIDFDGYKGKDKNMSAIIVLSVAIPAAAAAWPAIAAAAVAAAGALGLGYAAASSTKQTDNVNSTAEVELSVSNSCAAIEDLPMEEDIVFSGSDVSVTFFRDSQGKMGVRVHGKGKQEAELHEIGEKFVNKLVQQYAYNRLVTELKQRNFSVVNEQIEEDGTVRLQARIFQG
ncbi:MAG: DUF1257 domain-containing protein [Pseudomonadota bacterium]